MKKRDHDAVESILSIWHAEAVLMGVDDWRVGEIEAEVLSILSDTCLLKAGIDADTRNGVIRALSVLLGEVCLPHGRDAYAYRYEVTRSIMGQGYAYRVRRRA